MPWGIRFSAAEGRRIADDEWVSARVGAEGRKLLLSGVLPMREHDRRPQCVFLDEDQRCGLQREKGHEFIPRACQVFPFGFMRSEDNRLIGSLSQLCPSVRDDYGEPAAPQLPSKLEQQGAVDKMSTAMSTLTGIILSRSQYLTVASHWRAEITGSSTPLTACAQLFDWMAAFELALPSRLKNSTGDKVSDDVVARAIDEASQNEPQPLVLGGKNPGYHGRMLFAHLLGNLCYPSRVQLDHRVERAPWFHFEKARAFLNRVAWLLDWGTLDMMFIERPVPLRKVSRIEPPATGELGDMIASFLALAIDRRQLFAKPRQLQNVLLDLAIAATVSSRFARCRAAADGRVRADRADVAEGIGIAELLIVSHASVDAESDLLKNLRWTMLTQTMSLRRLLAAESSS